METCARLIGITALICLPRFADAVPAHTVGAGALPGGEQVNGRIDYCVIVDEHDTPLPTETVHCNYYNRTGGDRGVLHAEEVTYGWDGCSAYSAAATGMAGSWTWGGMWYSLIRIDRDNIPVDFGAIFGPYVKPEYQGCITEVKVAVEGVTSPSNNAQLELRIEIKDEAGELVGHEAWTDLASMSYPAVFTWSLPEDCKQDVEQVLWLLDKAQVGDSITVDSVRLTAEVPDLTSIPTQEQAFLWTYAWLMANYDSVTGMFQDRSNFGSGDFENVSATAKAAKIVYYAYRKGYTTRAHAEQIITKIADTLTNTVPRGPASINTLWPHFTCNGGQDALPPHGEFAGTEWASGDTAFAALDIIAALQMLGDPEDQIPALEQFVRSIDWDALLTAEGCISHGYAYCGARLGASWRGFGMETVGVNWAYASATGKAAAMGPDPSDNGSGFIDNAHYPIVLSSLDHWGNCWDVYREEMADRQIDWYSPERNPYLSGAGLFGLSAAEVPEAFFCPDEAYTAYGIGGRYACPEDGAGEVIVLHFSGMIADIKPDDAKRVWRTLRGEPENPASADFLEAEVVISPLNNMESMRVDRDSGECTINHLKGSWNLTLQAEGWAFADSAVRQDLDDAIDNSPFLRAGRDLVTSTGPLAAGFSAHPTSGAAPLQVQFEDCSIGGPTGWHWDFGDGADSDLQRPSHEYPTPGCYTVTLAVEGEADTAAQTKEHYIRVAFPDVPVPPAEDCHWAALQVIGCATDNVVQGFPNGRYRPDVVVTRDQMAVFVARGMVAPCGDDCVPPGPDTPSFSDVPREFWAYDHIEYCVNEAVVEGYPDGRYRPDVVVTRDQMAVYIARAVVAPCGDDCVPPGPEDPTFSDDVPTDFWAYDHIEYCAGEGVVQGYPDGLYRPGIEVTRDQMAVYVARAFDLHS